MTVLVDTSVWIRYLRGIGWIDAHLLPSALVARLRLWTADPRRALLAQELRAAYD
jgi:predicted nucleic acid-binding protein